MFPLDLVNAIHRRPEGALLGESRECEVSAPRMDEAKEGDCGDLRIYEAGRTCAGSYSAKKPSNSGCRLLAVSMEPWSRSIEHEVLVEVVGERFDEAVGDLVPDLRSHVGVLGE